MADVLEMIKSRPVLSLSGKSVEIGIVDNCGPNIDLTRGLKPLEADLFDGFRLKGIYETYDQGKAFGRA